MPVPVLVRKVLHYACRESLVRSLQICYLTHFKSLLIALTNFWFSCIKKKKFNFQMYRVNRDSGNCFPMPTLQLHPIGKEHTSQQFANRFS